MREKEFTVAGNGPPLMAGTYYDCFADLPLEAELNPRPRQWRRGRTWDSGDIRYARPAAFDAAVTPEQHATLVTALRGVRLAWKNTHEAVMSRWPADFAKRERKVSDPRAETRLRDGMGPMDSGPRDQVSTVPAATFDPGSPASWALPSQHSWPDGLSDRVLDGYKRTLAFNERLPGSIAYATGEHAASKALRVFEKQVRETGGAPYLHPIDELAGGVSVRLPVGKFYGDPVRWDGRRAWLGDLGLVSVPNGTGDLPAAPGDAAYAEMAHWERRWRLRLVFVGPRPPKKEKK